LRLEVITKCTTFRTKPCEVTAYIDLDHRWSIRLPAVSTLFRCERWPKVPEGDKALGEGCWRLGSSCMGSPSCRRASLSQSFYAVSAYLIAPSGSAEGEDGKVSTLPTPPAAPGDFEAERFSKGSRNH
jgi:hypothetical protein